MSFPASASLWPTCSARCAADGRRRGALAAILRRGLLGSLSPKLPAAGLASREPVTAPPALLVAPARGARPLAAALLRARLAT